MPVVVGMDLTSMTSAFNTIKGDALSAIGVIAPIGLGIVGVILVWKIGMKVFGNLTNRG